MKMEDLLKTKPYKHQHEAYLFACKLDAAALLMEQGTGKTLVAIAVSGYRFKRGEVNRVLVVSPLSVVGNWEEEYQNHAKFGVKVIPIHGGSSADNADLVYKLPHSSKNLMVLVVNYDTVWRIGDAIEHWNPQMVILDESQFIKNGTARRSKFLHRLGDRTRYKLILSGTPITESPLDIWSQYRFLNPYIYGKSYTKFDRRYTRRNRFFRYKIRKFVRMGEFTKKLHSVAFRVTKDEALDLPPEVNQNIYVDLPPETKRIYREMEKEFITYIEDKAAEASIALTKILRLQQITGGHITVEDEEENKEVIELESNKLAALQELLEGWPKSKKVVIFCYFRPEVEAITNLARSLGRPTLEISGRIKGNRKEIENTFKNSKRFNTLVCQIKSGGVGMNLQAANTSVFYSTGYSYHYYSQARSRVHRAGQKRKVTHIHLITRGTVDEDIVRVLQAKGSMAEMLVDILRRTGVMAKKKAKGQDFQKKLEELKMELEAQAEDIDEDIDEVEEPAPKKSEKRKKKSKKRAGKEEEPVKKAKKKKVKETPEPEDESPEEEEEETGQVVTAKELASELGMSPSQLRKKLRQLVKDGVIEHEKNGRWEWSPNSKSLKKIRELLG